MVGMKGGTVGTIEIVSRSLGRGSWPRRAWLAPSVGPRRPGQPPLGPPPCYENADCGKVLERLNVFSSFLIKSNDFEGSGSDARCVTSFGEDRTEEKRTHDGEDVAEYTEDGLYLIAALTIAS
ncbi:hypothetical protein V1477_009701, partial [Vespula maculifrons]